MLQPFLLLFIATYLGHIAADYLFQGDRIALGKMTMNASGFRHACEHGAHLALAQLAWILLIMAGTSTPVSTAGIGAALAINAVSHIFIDWGRQGPWRWRRLLGVRKTDDRYLGNSQPTVERPGHTHGIEHVDQALHIQLMGVGALAGALMS